VYTRRRLGFEIRLPIIQAPMAGSGINTPQLAAAVSNAGGLGSLATAYLSIPQVERAIRQVRELTERPFAVNLFAPCAREALAGDVESQVRLLAPIHQRLGLDPPVLPQQVDEPFQELVELLISLHISIVSFTFGMLPKDVLDYLKSQGGYLMGTATTVAEAKLLESAGVDAVIAQGSESGGHRGSFSSSSPSTVGTMALVPQIVDAIQIPVIASGGIMDGRGVVAALALGASAVQMGTAFLTCAESGAPEVYKQAVLEAADDSTALTRAFSGRWACGIRNEFMEQSERSQSEPISFPWQNALTRDMRSTAAKKGDKELLSLWAGQGTRMARRLTAAELMAALESEIHQTRRALRE
jgi:nitronate monooxygenase